MPAPKARLGTSSAFLLLLAAHLGLLFVFDLAHRLVLTLSLLGLAFAALPFAARRLDSATRPGRLLLYGTLALRLCLLPLPPTLSDDVLRYLWDGKVAAAGFNPYALSPAAEELVPLRTSQRVPHPEIPTVYPPLAVAAFSIASRFPFPLFAWKLFATAADLAACALLAALARRRGVPVGRAAWYAWNPLVTLEVAGMGHVDALGVAAVIGVVLALTPGADPGPHRPRAKGPFPLPGGGGLEQGEGQDGGCVRGQGGEASLPWAAGSFAAGAALAKLVPLLAFPLWARASPRPFRFLAVAFGLTLVALLPVVAATRGIPPGLVRYGISWEFNGPVYEPLYRLLGRAGAAPWIAARLEANEAATRDWYRWDRVYPYLYPELLAKVLLAGGVLVTVALSLRDRDPVAGTGRLFGRLLLLSATVYPWYLLWVLPWAALEGWTAWRLLSGLMLLAYLAGPGGLPLWPWIYLVIWGPFALAAVLARMRYPARR